MYSFFVSLYSTHSSQKTEKIKPIIATQNENTKVIKFKNKHLE